MTAEPALGAARIEGLDVARALAVLGMTAAHIGNSGRRGTPDGWGWLWIADGRPSAIFAVLAGVSMSLMAARALRRADATDRYHALQHTRIRVAMRGAILIVAGYSLSALGTPVVVILAHLGVMMLAGAAVLGWRAGWLGLAALVPVGTGWFALSAAHAETWPSVPVVGVLWSSYYPVASWMGYVLAGMALGRLALEARRVQVWLAGAGAGLAGVAYSMGPLLGGSGVDPAQPPGTVEWASVLAHSSTPFEMLGNLGVAMAVIAGCVAVTPYLRPALWPLIATGSMAFTVYTLQIVVLALVGSPIVFAPTNTALIALCAGLVAFACLWRWLAGQGPLERGMTRASTSAADAVVGPVAVASPAGSADSGASARRSLEQ